MRRHCALIAAILVAFPCFVHAEENAAVQYWLAFSELSEGLPRSVLHATTDDKDFGFALPLSEEQLHFLETDRARRIDYRFRKAAALDSCVWGRNPADGAAYLTSTINQSAHSLARLALLHARREYEAQRWKNGHEYVVNTMRMARRVARQIRPGETYCFMIENMARSTACAYFPVMPAEHRTALAARVQKLPVLLAAHDAYFREAKLYAGLSESLAGLPDDAQRKQRTIKLLRVVLPASEAELISERYPVDELEKFLRGTAALQRKIGDLMQKPIADSDTAYKSLVQHVIADNPIARALHGDDDYSNWLRREDAQSECRYDMFFAAVDILQNGKSALASHVDRFGSEPYQIVKTSDGFNLVSQLTYGTFDKESKKWSHNVSLTIGRLGPQASPKND